MTEQNVKDTLNPQGPSGAPAGAAVLEPPAEALQAATPMPAPPGLQGQWAQAAASRLDGEGLPAASGFGDGAGLGAGLGVPAALRPAPVQATQSPPSSAVIASAATPIADSAEPSPPVSQTTESVTRGPGLPSAPAASPDPAGDEPFNLEDWFATPQGAYVLNWEMARVDQVVADLFGYYAVQIGLPGIDFLRANRITSRLTASLRGSPSVVADAHELPFENESLDLVVLPHLLEFSSEPHQILREVERVLRPEGQVVILCFNPVSLWGVKKLFAAPPHAPWNGEFVSVLRMKDWLKLLNFEMRGGRFGCYRPPYTSDKWLSRFGFLEKAGDRWWPVAGAVYLMQAKKRVPGMRIITPAWRKERRKADALAPSTNGVNRGTHNLGDLPGTYAPQPVHHNLRNKKDPE